MGRARDESEELADKEAREAALRTIFKAYGWDPDRALTSQQVARLRQLYRRAEQVVAETAERASPKSDGVERAQGDLQLRRARLLMATQQRKAEEMRIMLEASRRAQQEALARKRKQG